MVKLFPLIIKDTINFYSEQGVMLYCFTFLNNFGTLPGFPGKPFVKILVQLADKRYGKKETKKNTYTG